MLVGVVVQDERCSRVDVIVIGMAISPFEWVRRRGSRQRYVRTRVVCGPPLGCRGRCLSGYVAIVGLG